MTFGLPYKGSKNKLAAAPEHLYTTPRFAHLFHDTLF